MRNDVLKKMNTVPKAVSDRIIVMRLPLSKNKFATIISTYAPTMTYPEPEKEEYYRSLSDVVGRVSTADKLVILGDFNARVGSDHELYGPALGKFGKGSCNSNGELLLNFCTQFGLVVTNTYFNQPDRNYFTWNHPRFKKSYLLDYVLTRNEHISDKLNTKAMRGSECATDHYIVISSLRFRLTMRSRRAPQAPKRFDVKKLKSEDVKDEFNAKLLTKIPELRQTHLVEEKWSKMKDVLQKTCTDVLGHLKRRNEDWFDEYYDEIEPLLEEKRKCHQRPLNRVTRQTTEDFRKAKAATQRKTRQLKNRWWTKKVKSFQSMTNRNDTKGFYDGLKKIYGHRANVVTAIKNKEGELISEKEDIVARRKEHFQELLNLDTEIDDTVLENLNHVPIMHELENEITMAEFDVALKSMSNEKSPWFDGIPAEIYKNIGEEFKEELFSLFRLCWEEEKAPQDFKDALSVKIFKKGDKTLCDNYRGISLRCVAGKIYCKIILNRLKQLSEKILPESQSGFRSERSTNDMIFSLRQIQEKAIEQGQDLYVIFFDFKKAFDTVSRDMLWKVLEILGCPRKFVNIVKDLHINMRAKVSVSGSISDDFEVKNGVKQGDPAAPTYFTLFLTAILNLLAQATQEGVYIRTRSDGKLFNLSRLKATTKVRTELIRDLLYADDAAMVTHSLEAIQEVTSRFSEISKAFGLQISTHKTELLYQLSPNNQNRDNVQPIVTIDGEALNMVHKFKYLGSYVSDDIKVDTEISHRIQMASAAYGKLKKRLFDSHDISLVTKLAVFRAVVLSALLYAIDTMTLYRRHINKLTNFQIRHLRQMLKLQWSDKIPNVEVLKRAEMPSVEALITKAQLRWTGHVVRMEENRLPTILLYGELLDGTRRVGGQKLRYKDVIKRHLNKMDCDVNTWERDAKDRDVWKTVVKDSVTRIEESRLKNYQRRRQSRYGTLATKIQCNRCRRCFISNAGKALHIRADKCMG